GHDGADVPPCVADRLHGHSVPSTDERDDVALVPHGRAALAQLPGHRGPGGHGLQAAEVAAGAQGPVAVGHGPVAKVAGRALGTALQDTSADDARTDAGGHLHEDQVVDVRVGLGALAQGHDVDVIVHEDRSGQHPTDEAGDVEAVPPRH